MDFFSNQISPNTFKKRIFELIRPCSKTIYDIHDPIGCKFIFQLRTGLSPLKQHKMRHNFSDTPDDLCDCLNASEDISHFLFYCSRYAIPRLELNFSVLNVLNANNLIHLSTNVELFLYGHHSLQLNDNKSIILSTINFIKETKRFS